MTAALVEEVLEDAERMYAFLVREDTEKS